MTSPQPRIVILDAHTTQPGDLDWEDLSRLGSLTVFERTAPAQIVERAGDADIVLTNKCVLTRETLARLPRARLVCLMSTGTNAVDLEACAERGIPVCNVPAYSTASVAELVFALVFAWARAPETHADSVRGGDWAASPDFCYALTPQRELHGTTLGIVGFGEIGQAVAKIGAALGMRVLAHTPRPDGKPDLGQSFVSLEELFRRADVLSLHCPLSPDTRHLVNRDSLALMKPDALLVNTGRGDLVEETALAEALRTGRLSCAALDVLSTEPPKPDNPLPPLKNARITPHIGWATREARARLIRELTRNVGAFLEGSPRNVVNGV